jgi:aminopeptidase N
VISRFRLREPGKYLAVAVGRLQPVGERQAGSVRLNAYATSLRRGTSDGLLARAEDMIAFYTRLFGPCPYATINLVAFDADTPGGHSPPGLVALSFRSLLRRTALRDDPASFDDVPGFFLAHELAHQWWGQGVAGENYHERWLSEGAAQYAAALWTRHAHGEAAFQGVLRRLGRWARRMHAQGPIHLGYRLGHLAQDPQIYRAIVYNKGAYVLHMLRGLVGPEAFESALRAFQAEHRYAKAGSDDLRAALERASGLDLSAYFEAWVRGTRLPRLRAHWQVDRHDASRTRVRLEAEGLPGPVPLTLTLARGSATRSERLSLPAAGAEFEFKTPFQPTRVDINSDLGLLAEVD